MMKYGMALVRRNDDGTLTVEHADDTIGIAIESLPELADNLPVDDDGCVMLAGFPEYRYRPVRFDALYRGGSATVLVCERVREPARQRVVEGVG